jgi:hypothetical protein
MWWVAPLELPGRDGRGVGRSCPDQDNDLRKIDLGEEPTIGRTYLIPDAGKTEPELDLLGAAVQPRVK